MLGSHVYGHEGFYSITVTVYEDNVGSAAATATTSVADAPVFLTSFSLPSGGSVNGQVATFVDYDNSGTSAGFMASIAWGDGTTSNGVITETGVDALGHVNFAVTAQHTYTSVPTSAARITITDLRGGTSTSMANDGSDAVETTVFFDQTTGTFKVIRYTYR